MRAELTKVGTSIIGSVAVRVTVIAGLFAELSLTVATISDGAVDLASCVIAVIGAVVALLIAVDQTVSAD